MLIMARMATVAFRKGGWVSGEPVNGQTQKGKYERNLAKCAHDVTCSGVEGMRTDMD